MPKPRASVQRMAERMETKLQINDDGKGDWRYTDPMLLFLALRAEVHELKMAIEQGAPAAIEFEAADVCNFAMMICDTISRDVADEIRGQDTVDRTESSE